MPMLKKGSDSLPGGRAKAHITVPRVSHIAGSLRLMVSNRQGRGIAASENNVKRYVALPEPDWFPSRSEAGRVRASSSAVQLKIGSKGSSGSPGKYICVTRRVAKAGPKSEK